MATGLGHGIGNSLIWHGRNDGATTIDKGEVAKIDVTAIATADGLNNDPVFAIQLNDTLDSITGAGSIVMGIALDDIVSGEVGPICVLGLVKAKYTSASVAPGTVVGISNAGSAVELADIAAASEEAPCGICLETTTAGGLHWTFFDAISASFSGQAFFWGQAY